MNDEDELQQQQQPLSSPTDNNLPEWKSSDPYLASILRHLRATDQHLDSTCLLLTALQNGAEIILYETRPFTLFELIS